MGREDLSCAARVAEIERAAQAIEGPIVIVAHSGGCIMVAHWARQTRRSRAGRAARGAARLRDADAGRLPDGRRLARRRLAAGAARSGCRSASIVAASRNDPLATYQRARRAWPTTGAAELVDLGNVGHLNPGLGLRRVAAGRRIHRELSIDATARRAAL